MRTVARLVALALALWLGFSPLAQAQAPKAICETAAMNNSTPGRFWKGHGLIQITGYDNHRECGLAIGVDCMNKPCLLELPVYAARSAAWFWLEHDINKYADAGDFDGVSDVINRGRKTAKEGDANGYDDRLKFYQRSKEVLGC